MAVPGPVTFLFLDPEFPAKLSTKDAFDYSFTKGTEGLAYNGHQLSLERVFDEEGKRFGFDYGKPSVSPGFQKASDFFQEPFKGFGVKRGGKTGSDVISDLFYNRDIVNPVGFETET